MIEPKSHGVLDTRFRGYDSVVCDGATTSLRGAKRRSNPSFRRRGDNGLLRFARNDGPSIRNSSQQIRVLESLLQSIRDCTCDRRFNLA
jgi:hypothetical protein